jgi:hypothetical protein
MTHKNYLLLSTCICASFLLSCQRDYYDSKIDIVPTIIDIEGNYELKVCATISYDSNSLEQMKAFAKGLENRNARIELSIGFNSCEGSIYPTKEVTFVITKLKGNYTVDGSAIYYSGKIESLAKDIKVTGRYTFSDIKEGFIISSSLDLLIAPRDPNVEELCSVCDVNLQKFGKALAEIVSIGQTGKSLSLRKAEYSGKEAAAQETEPPEIFVADKVDYCKNYEIGYDAAEANLGKLTGAASGVVGLFAKMQVMQRIRKADFLFNEREMQALEDGIDDYINKRGRKY